MASLLDRWFHRDTTVVTSNGEGTGLSSFSIPVHWLDVTPVDSTDKACSLKSLDVQAHVCGLYAEVTQTLVVRNPNRRPISANFVIPLPDRAVVCGYALDIDGTMVDGVVVEKEKARVAFETEQRRGADPGLVEAVRGNVYRTRVYPVAAMGTRTLRLSYVTPLLLQGGRAATLDLPMPAERIHSRTLRIEVEMLDCPAPVVSGIGDALMSEAQGLWVVEHEDSDLTPTEPVRVAMPVLPTSFVTVERDDEGTVWFSASEEMPEVVEEEATPITSLTVLWDASGSRAGVDHAAELELLRAYCGSPSTKSLTLVVFGDRVREVREFTTAEELVEHVCTLRYDGGTDLTALASALADLPAACGGIAQGNACVLFCDGLDTLSDKPFQLPEGCDALAVVTGTERDAESLRQACHGLAFDLALAPRDAEGLSRALSHGNPSRLLDVRGSGIAEVCDTSSADGGRRAVIGKLTVEETEISLGASGTSFALLANDAREGSVLARAWASRRVTLLSPRANENADELLRIGKRFGVASPVTSLLVLESLDQWLRYDIEPPKTWTDMHERWVQAQAGKMRLFSERGRKLQHRRSLVSSWADLQEWWKCDYVMPAEWTVHGSPLPLSAIAIPTGIAEPDFSDFGEGLADYAEEGESDSRWERPMPTSAEPRHHMPRARMAEPEGMPDSPEFFLRSISAAPASASAPAPRATGFASAPLEEGESRHDSPRPSAPQPPTAAAVHVRPWMPDTPYLKRLNKALTTSLEEARNTYHEMRGEFSASPSFFLDCAGWFMKQGDEDFGICVLSNLAEMRIEDAAFLRVMGWRLREAGRLEQALVALRRAQSLRNEDSQGHRDVALVLDELARAAYARGDEEEARAFAEESGKLYRKVALTPWQRRAIAVALFAVEEYNVLRAWAGAQEWKVAPDLPSLGEDLEGVPDCDLRITLAWDADETDVDIHVTEPTLEEAYYGHRLTTSGGRVSEDITDGYGPELYEVRHAMQGVYLIRAHYFASHQQTIFGPATCTLTVYTDWGRPSQTQKVTSTRLDRAREMTDVGTAAYGKAAERASTEAEEPAVPEQQIVRDMEMDAVREILGEPEKVDDTGIGAITRWEWSLPDGRTLVAVFFEGKLKRVLERMSWGEEMIVIQ